MNKTQVGLIFFVVFISIICGIAILMDYQINEGCKELGFKGYHSTENFRFCVDEEDNLHYINIDMNGLFKKATIKEISVGDVRVLKDKG